MFVHLLLLRLQLLESFFMLLLLFQFFLMIPFSTFDLLPTFLSAIFINTVLWILNFWLFS